MVILQQILAKVFLKLEKVLKIKDDGTTVWKKRYPQHGELTDIAVTKDGYFLSGHKESFKGGIDGSVTKISPNGLVIWNKVFGNPEGGTNNFFRDLSSTYLELFG